MPETNYEARLRQEYACYSAEMDLWDSTKLAKLNQQEESRRLMESLNAKIKLS